MGVDSVIMTKFYSLYLKLSLLNLFCLRWCMCGKCNIFFFSEYGRYLEDALNSVEPKVFVKRKFIIIIIKKYTI